MLNRRDILVSATALGACAIAPPANPNPNPSDFRALLVALEAASPSERAARLRNIAPDALSADDRVLLESVRTGIEAEAALAAMPYGQNGRPYIVTHRAGAYRRIADELGGDGVALAADLDAETARIEADAARGVIPPDFIVARTIAALEAAREPLTVARSVAAAAIGAAHSRQLAALRALPRRTSAGVGALPDGESYYRHALEFALGGPVSPREAHALAAAQCERLTDEAHELFREIGVEPPRYRHTIGHVLAREAEDPAHLYPDDAQGRARAVSDMNAQLTLLRTLLPRAFSGLENTPAEVRGMSAEEEARGAQGRREGAAYIVDLARVRTRPAWTLPSVVAHETLPGHLLQAPLQQAASPPRLQLRASSGYSEGWAIYAEDLVAELGFYEGRPRERLGYVHWLMFRWARVLVDTGVHAMDWSRGRALETWREFQGFDVAFVSIEDDLDRICVEPGVFAAQGLAAHTIHAQRARAERRYGARFDLKQFHDAVLRRGPLSPPGMAQSVRTAFS